MSVGQYASKLQAAPHVHTYFGTDIPVPDLAPRDQDRRSTFRHKTSAESANPNLEVSTAFPSRNMRAQDAPGERASSVVVASNNPPPMVSKYCTPHGSLMDILKYYHTWLPLLCMPSW